MSADVSRKPNVDLLESPGVSPSLDMSQELVGTVFGRRLEIAIMSFSSLFIFIDFSPIKRLYIRPWLVLASPHKLLNCQIALNKVRIRRTCRTATMGTPLHINLGTFVSQFETSTVPFTSKLNPWSVSKSFALALTSVYAPIPGSGQEKKPKSKY